MLSKLKDRNKMIEKFCGKRYFFTYIDILWCWLRYGFSIDEYFRWTIYDMSGLKRRTFITSRNESHLWSENSKEIKMIFGNKAAFLEQYSDFTKREFIDLSKATFDEFSEFAKKHKTIFLKYLWASGGMGATIYNYSNDDDLRTFYSSISPENEKNGYVAEELIIQHPKMYQLGKNSVNTIRVATYTYDGNTYILGCTVRMGGDGCTDNYSVGGSCAAVDISTGIIVSDCYRDETHRWIKHPYTGEIVYGFQIPHWDKVINICREAAAYKTGANYIGWDVAVLEDGVSLVEANTNHGIFQVVDKIGKYGIIKKIRRGQYDYD